jgi:hypothetical protein
VFDEKHAHGASTQQAVFSITSDDNRSEFDRAPAAYRVVHGHFAAPISKTEADARARDFCDGAIA